MTPEGTYQCVIEASSSSQTSKGTPQIVIEVTTAWQLVGTEWAEYKGAKANVFIYLSDGAWPHSVKKLKALGWNGNLDDVQFANAAEGVRLTCKHEMYDNQLRERWEFADFEGGNDPLDDNKKGGIHSKWQMEQAAVPAAAPPAAPATPPAAAPAAPPAGGAVPFEQPGPAPTQ